MDNLKKLVTQDTQDEEKQNKDRTQYTKANTNNVKKTPVLLQTTGGKDEPYYASNLMRNVISQTS